MVKGALMLVQPGSDGSELRANCLRQSGADGQVPQVASGAVLEESGSEDDGAMDLTEDEISLVGSLSDGNGPGAEKRMAASRALLLNYSSCKRWPSLFEHATEEERSGGAREKRRLGLLSFYRGGVYFLAGTEPLIVPLWAEPKRKLCMPHSGKTKWFQCIRNHDDHTCAENKAHCEVEIISWRERKIKASILVCASRKKVWQVLTDYERLSEFIPNLICSERIPCPYPGRIWLHQRGMQRTMYWNIEAQVILDLKEEKKSELHFSMVDGDFKRYDGKWSLQAGPRHCTTMLFYEVNVVPKLFFPAAFVESIIKADLPTNLYALARRAETICEVVPTSSLCLNVTSIMEECTPSLDHGDTSRSSVPPSISESMGDDVLEMQHQGVVVGENSASTATSSALNWQSSSFGKACHLGHRCVIDEIHFRRLDDLLENGGAHRRVVATITVKAPCKDVWTVLTAYEKLPEFVPNLASSVVLSREKKRVRLLQEGCKCLLYMVLHARVTLDLWEYHEQEIIFRQVEGDFDSFHGTWLLKPFGSQHTVLKYMVDTKIRKDCFLAESIVEEVIYEDLPSNLCAIRDRVERTALSRSMGRVLSPESQERALDLKESPLKSTGSGNQRHAEALKQRRKRRPRSKVIQGLTHDYGVLEEEVKKFITAYGNEGVMPMRDHMRHCGRIDLEKAITAMGGFRTIAARMKLMLQYKERKPHGYWNRFQNLKSEVIAFQKETGHDLMVMPSRRLMERLGRYDLSRALEKWGGLREVAKLLGLKQGKQHSNTLENRMIEIPSDFEAQDGVKQVENLSNSLDTNLENKCENISSSRETIHLNPIQNNSEEVKAAEECVVCSSDSSEEHLSNDRTTRMPLKADVCHKSSKWLTLFSDCRKDSD